MKRNSSLYFLSAAACVLLITAFSSCMKVDVFEKNVQIPQHEWKWDNQPEIKFDITDTASAYNIFITLRHTDAYEYRNIWLFVYTQQPGDTGFQKARIELPLQNAGGKWLSATGMDDIWEHRIKLFDKLQFRKSGAYRIRLEQNMRDNPLKHVMNAGIRIEKAN